MNGTGWISSACLKFKIQKFADFHFRTDKNKTSAMYGDHAPLEFHKNSCFSIRERKHEVNLSHQLYSS